MINKLPATLEDLDEAITHASPSTVKEVVDFINQKLIGATAAQRADALVAVQTFVEAVLAAYKPLSELQNRLRTALIPEAFEREGLTTLTLKSGYRVTMSSVLRASIREGCKNQAFDWLRENDLDDLITETVNAGTLSAAVKTMANEGKEPPDTIFNVHLLPQVSVTKTAK